MAQTPSGPMMSAAQGPPMSFTGMDAPSTKPDVPVTDGAASGMGAGPEALGPPTSNTKMDAQALAKYLPTFIAIAEKEDTPAGTKRWVRNLIANM